jgi:hypothetical protein
VVQLPTLEDDQPSVDSLAPERLNVLPGDARDVDRSVRDPQLSNLRLWNVRHSFDTVV